MSTETFIESNDDIPADELLLATHIANSELRTKQDNADFAKLGARKKRVAIAQDVLKWLASGVLKATEGTYINTNEDVNKLDEAQQAGIKCSACALGAVFAVCTVRKPDLKIHEQGDYGAYTHDSEEMRNMLAPYFSKDQLMLIENAFEGDFINYKDDFENHSQKKYDAAVYFNKGFRSSTTRMRRIMENIIENNGTFRP